MCSLVSRVAWIPASRTTCASARREAGGGAEQAFLATGQRPVVLVPPLPGVRVERELGQAGEPRRRRRGLADALRYGGTDAEAAGIIGRAETRDAVRVTAVEIAAAHVNKAGASFGTTKSCMYAAALALLRRRQQPPRLSPQHPR